MLTLSSWAKLERGMGLSGQEVEAAASLRLTMDF